MMRKHALRGVFLFQQNWKNKICCDILKFENTEKNLIQSQEEKD